MEVLAIQIQVLQDSFPEGRSKTGFDESSSTSNPYPHEVRRFAQKVLGFTLVGS